VIDTQLIYIWRKNMMEMEATYNYFLVALSFLVSVFGSYTGLLLMRGARDAKGKSAIAWILAAAFALGGGAIWTMHFIGMIAYEVPSMEMAYDPVLTFASLALAVGVVGLGIFLLSKNQQSILVLLVAGVITGLGVATMHYTGMEAMVMAADMEYDSTIFAISIVIALVAATAALWLAFNTKSGIQMFAASVVMGLAVCGMHYTGMASMTMVHNGQEVDVSSSIAPLTLGLFIFCFTMLVLVLSLIVTLSQLQKRMYEQMEDEEDDAMDEAKPHLV
jgi:NO-binding membrane sensor protein with MHYT domain